VRRRQVECVALPALSEGTNGPCQSNERLTIVLELQE
jgi:hypothetical protein